MEVQPNLHHRYLQPSSTLLGLLHHRRNHAEDGEHICARADLRPLGSSEAPLVGVPKPRPRPPPSRIRGEAAGQEGLACRSRPRPTYGCDTPLAKQLRPLHISEEKCKPAHCYRRRPTCEPAWVVTCATAQKGFRRPDTVHDK
ncbi:uncharacterized protein LOC124696812 [Lolium rigidum]|uniref:uncharacterized protein LOC124696812 n=1 Tax=Lolium rigidum TaxID=89674 RepID=UPI001F5D9CAF|nr:uncharacterized protein LOC124696812 [Lolium rigidum]